MDYTRDVRELLHSLPFSVMTGKFSVFHVLGSSFLYPNPLRIVILLAERLLNQGWKLTSPPYTCESYRRARQPSWDQWP